ncbi:hypothetical protein Ga0609869_002653 [Rhodovulum iodosum]|uniref:Uncharacterized protein n=1 Tax=Rhodovulum iodosum TaxID=68291 RepID=A0ABV3XVG4_9RHOB
MKKSVFAAAVAALAAAPAMAERQKCVLDSSYSQNLFS